MATTTTLNIALPSSAADWTPERRLGYFEGHQNMLANLIAVERSLMRSGAANPQGVNTPSGGRRSHRRKSSAKTT